MQAIWYEFFEWNLVHLSVHNNTKDDNTDNIYAKIRIWSRHVRMASNLDGAVTVISLVK
jgi:hypothetical protein